VTYATTEYIAGWLVEASKKIGFSLNDVQASLPVESQRLKGKDRKKAKEAAKAQLAAAAAAAKKQPSRYHIRASDFVPIAEAIAKHAKKVKVPSPLLQYSAGLSKLGKRHRLGTKRLTLKMKDTITSSAYYQEFRKSNLAPSHFHRQSCQAGEC
jgi:predicted ABC-class ATPase